MSGVVSYGTISPVTGWSVNESTKVLTFTTPGTYTFIPNRGYNVDYTVVAGGGAGASGGLGPVAGGGGGGETKVGSFGLVNSESYTITVGNGTRNNNGSNSIFNLITAEGGRRASGSIGGAGGGVGNSGAGGRGGDSGSPGNNGYLGLYGGGGGGGGGAGAGGAGGGGAGGAGAGGGAGGAGSPNTGGGGGGGKGGSSGGSGIVILSNFTPSSVAPTITDFSIQSKIYGEPSFTIDEPSSNSTGLFTYESLTPLIATIEGNTITIVGPGQATIRATQAATPNYLSGTIDTTFLVNQSTATNPTNISTAGALEYFLNSTTAKYANIASTVQISKNLQSLMSEKKLFTTQNNVKISHA
jgi:hypothetical protein